MGQTTVLMGTILCHVILQMHDVLCYEANNMSDGNYLMSCHSTNARCPCYGTNNMSDGNYIYEGKNKLSSFNEAVHGYLFLEQGVHFVDILLLTGQHEGRHALRVLRRQRRHLDGACALGGSDHVISCSLPRPPSSHSCIFYNSSSSANMEKKFFLCIVYRATYRPIIYEQSNSTVTK